MMSAFTNSLASSLLASSILISGVTPVLAQYSCPSREIQSVHEVGDFKFELQGCQRQSTKLTCQAWVTASKDVETLYRGDQGTRLVDVSGTQYVPSSVQGASKNSTSYIRVSLVKDVPMKISATFADIPASVQDIALFEVDINTGKNGQLRNIKITESKVGSSSSPIKKKK